VVPPKRPTSYNAGDASPVFHVLQGIGEDHFVPWPERLKRSIFGIPVFAHYTFISPTCEEFQMKRETAEKIIDAMKEMDVALNKVHDALCKIENEEVRKQILMKYFDLVNDAHVNITMNVVKYCPHLQPDKLQSRRAVDT
jgi:hypothetical protein